MEKVVWVLGSEHSNAHNCIPWNSSFPNFANSDILIVNLQSLNENLFRMREEELVREAQKYVFDLLMTGEKETFVILPEDPLYLKWLPIVPILRDTAPIKVGDHCDSGPLEGYLKTVDDCSYYIHEFLYPYVEKKLNPASGMHDNYPFTSDMGGGYELFLNTDQEIMNKAKQLIGCRVHFTLRIYLESEPRFRSGSIYFVPPPTEVDIDKGVDILVNTMTGGELLEPSPDWEAEVDLPDLVGLELQIAQKDELRKKVVSETEDLEVRREEIAGFRRLLWTKGTPLENAVRDAFVFLGFSEIGKKRDDNLEDWVIKFESEQDYELGVLEVKGADRRTSLADLTQCNKWVEDYLLEGMGDAKGIFVTNQYRLEDIKKSREQREHFEENELRYARQREICILPSQEIFDAVVERMEDNTKINRSLIEERIASSKGICRLVGTQQE